MAIPRPKQNQRPGGTGPAADSFFGGKDTHSYGFFGFHLTESGAVFRVWAPRAESVFLCGEFNGWSVTSHPMRSLDGGVWEAVLPTAAVKEGQTYKYFLRRGEEGWFKADPYGAQMQVPPESASVICDLHRYRWRDEGWMRYRGSRFTRGEAEHCPINIYELHLGSWRRRGDGSPCTYGEIGAELIPYVKQMGYTHVELMPVAEHHFDGSWGYQVSGFYAPTARYGSPRELMSLIDGLHEAGIGVILDWVPAHFGVDAHGLGNFDGEPLYEYGDAARCYTPWGSKRFDPSRGEVRSFLLSNALYWAREFHADGLRVSSVDAMLYPMGEVCGEADPKAVEFLRELNLCMARECPDVMTFGESARGGARVTGFDEGGLGFTFAWNSRLVREGLYYLSQDPLWRKYHHHRLVGEPHGRGEASLLPLSHDEVVHGKRSLQERAPGALSLRMAGLRVFMTYTLTYPGKKLLFMGGELGEDREWDFSDQVQWTLLEKEPHARHQLFVAELNALYLRHPALWRLDGAEGGFRWIDKEDADRNLYSYLRYDGEGEALIVVLNFCPVRREGYWLSVPEAGEYEEIFNSDEARYGGEGVTNPGLLRSDARGVEITIPAMGAVILRHVPTTWRWG